MRLAIIAMVLGFAPPAIASDQSVIDFAPLISEVVVPIAAAIISGLLWALFRRIGLEMDRRAVLDAVEGAARQMIAMKGPVTVTASEDVARIANYIMQQAPDAARRLGLTASGEEGKPVPGAALSRIIETRIVGASLATGEALKNKA